MFLVDTDRAGSSTTTRSRTRSPARSPTAHGWSKTWSISTDLPDRRTVAGSRKPRPLARRQQAFGYTNEDLQIILAPMAANGSEPIGSMGNDTAAGRAVATSRRLLYNYFKQLFAQVTNPPLDAIREELVMCLRTIIGAEGNTCSGNARALPPAHADRPILTNERSGEAAQAG